MYIAAVSTHRRECPGQVGMTFRESMPVRQFLMPLMFKEEHRRGLPCRYTRDLAADKARLANLLSLQRYAKGFLHLLPPLRHILPLTHHPFLLIQLLLIDPTQHWIRIACHTFNPDPDRSASLQPNSRNQPRSE